MKHQPYFDWLFLEPSDQDPSLMSAQQESLQEHLQDCAECRRFSEAWQSVEHELRGAPQLSPRAGFTQRWKIIFEAERQRRHRRQTQLIFGLILSLAFGLLAILFLSAWPYLQSPELLIWSYIYQLLRWASFASDVRAFGSSVFQTFSSIFPLMGWVLVAGVLCQLVVLWFVSFRYLTMPRRVTK